MTPWMSPANMRIPAACKIAGVIQHLH
jgi:hypothetical protein